jgi:hypothetical protein
VRRRVGVAVAVVEQSAQRVRAARRHRRRADASRRRDASFHPSRAPSIARAALFYHLFRRTRAPFRAMNARARRAR